LGNKKWMENNTEASTGWFNNGLKLDATGKLTLSNLSLGTMNIAKGYFTKDYTIELYVKSHSATSITVAGQSINISVNELTHIAFITKNGTVYHRNRNCTYLNPSVKAVFYEDLKEKRNENGAIYYACEKCGNGKKTVVYITEQGTKYHTSLECSGLKRTIYSILLSEVGGRLPCSKCGG